MSKLKIQRGRYASTEEFVEVWNSSQDLAEVAARLGCMKRTCTLRARRLRLVQGLHLQAFKRGRPRKHGGGIKHSSYIGDEERDGYAPA